jgi:hypothetical protein
MTHKTETSNKTKKMAANEFYDDLADEALNMYERQINQTQSQQGRPESSENRLPTAHVTIQPLSESEILFFLSLVSLKFKNSNFSSLEEVNHKSSHLRLRKPMSKLRLAVFRTRKPSRKTTQKRTKKLAQLTQTSRDSNPCSTESTVTAQVTFQLKSSRNI